MREYNFEQEIDLLDLVWRLLEQWRGLVFVGLLSAAFGMLILARRGTFDEVPVDVTETLTQEAEAEAEADVAQTKTQKPEEIDPATVLTFDPNNEYLSACNDLAQYANYNTVKKLNEESVIMLCDFSQCTGISLVYEFEITGSNDVMRDCGIVKSLYSSITNNGDFAKKLTAVLSAEADENSLNDILKVSATSFKKNGTISFDATIPKNVDISEWSRALNDALIEYKQKNVDTVVPHSVKSVAINTKKASEASFFKLQNAKQTEIVKAQDSFNKLMNKTSAETKSLISKIIDENRNCCNYSVLKASLDEKWGKYSDEIVKKQEAELQKKKDKAAEMLKEELAGMATREELSKDEQDKAAAAKAELEKKQEDARQTVRRRKVRSLILCFLAGVCLYGLAFLLVYSFKHVIRNEEELNKMSGLRNFGGIYEYPRRNFLTRFVYSKHIYEIRRRRKKTPVQVGDDLCVKLEHTKMDKVKLISLGADSSEIINITDQITGCLKEKGINVDVRNIPGSVADVPDSEYVKMPPVLIELIGNRSKIENVKTLHFKLTEYDVPIVGYCYIEV